MTKCNYELLTHGLSELKKLQNHWSIVVLCLYEAGKADKIHLLDLLVEALDLKSYLKVPGGPVKQTRNSALSSIGGLEDLKKAGFINQAMYCVRDISSVQLGGLLNRWKTLTVGIPEIYDRVKELQSWLKPENGKCLKQDSIDISKCNRRHASKSQLNNKDSTKLHEKVVELLQFMVRDYMQPIECIPLHEIVCFKDVEKLQLALVGDPRRRIQVDLLESKKLLQCSCCSNGGKNLLPSLPDTSIMYNLAQEHGDVINLHDWYQSFKSIVVSPSSRKVSSRQSPLKKKRKDVKMSENLSEAVVQARFCRAIMDLQITGLIRMPTKRRPDFVQRVAFGL